MCLNTTPIMLCLWFPMWRCVIPDIYHAVQGNGCGWYLMGSCERDSLGLSLGAELHRWCSMRRCWRNSPESDTGLVWQFVASERRWWILILLFFLRACLLACSARMCGSLLRANEDDVIYASSCLLACLFAFIEVGRVHVCVHVRVMWVWLYTPPPAVAGTHMMAGLLLPATWIWWWWQTDDEVWFSHCHCSVIQPYQNMHARARVCCVYACACVALCVCGMLLLMLVLLLLLLLGWRQWSLAACPACPLHVCLRLTGWRRRRRRMKNKKKNDYCSFFVINKQPQVKNWWQKNSAGCPKWTPLFFQLWHMYIYVIVGL